MDDESAEPDDVEDDDDVDDVSEEDPFLPFDGADFDDEPFESARLSFR